MNSDNTMNKLNIILIGCVIVLIAYIAWPKNQLLGGIYSNPGIVDLGNSGLASTSFTNVASISATQLLAVNPTRAYAKCTNYGASRVDIAWSTTASKGWGFPLWASQSFEILATQNLYKGSVFAIAVDDPLPRVSCIER